MWKVFGAALVGLEVLHGAIPAAHVILPLGGSTIAQLGIIFGVGFMIHELRSH